MMTPFEEIMAARPRSGNNHGLSHNFITLYGGRPIEISFVEPDPESYHGEFYYNSRFNSLFKKIKTSDNRHVWKQVSE